MFIYFSGKTYPSTTADHLYVRFLAEALAKQYGDQFRLAVIGKPTDELKGIPTLSIPAPRHGRIVFYAVWLPFFILRNQYQRSGTIFFSNDLFILSILRFWKVVLHFRYLIFSDWHLLTDTWRDTYVAKGSDVCITTSDRLKSRLVDATGISSERVHVVYGGVDLSLYEASESTTNEILGLPASKRIVGYIGNFRTMGKEKGVRTMLEALPELDKDIVMAFIGGIPEEIREYRTYADSLGIDDRAVWIGHQSFSNVVSYERAVDVLVIPYPDEPHFREYGFPMKVYEYLAAGKPIVYSDLAIMKEVLDGKGISFVPGDASSLAKALTEALLIPVQESARLNHVVAKNYSWDAKAQNIATVIGRISDL